MLYSMTFLDSYCKEMKFYVEKYNIKFVVINGADKFC